MVKIFCKCNQISNPFRWRGVVTVKVLGNLRPNQLVQYKTLRSAVSLSATLNAPPSPALAITLLP
jgi:hypothetical protein